MTRGSSGYGGFGFAILLVLGWVKNQRNGCCCEAYEALWERHVGVKPRMNVLLFPITPHGRSCIYKSSVRILVNCSVTIELMIRCVDTGVNTRSI
jgi:hypothetical protein